MGQRDTNLKREDFLKGFRGAAVELDKLEVDLLFDGRQVHAKTPYREHYDLDKCVELKTLESIGKAGICEICEVQIKAGANRLYRVWYQMVQVAALHEASEKFKQAAGRRANLEAAIEWVEIVMNISVARGLHWSVSEEAYSQTRHLVAQGLLMPLEVDEQKVRYLIAAGLTAEMSVPAKAKLAAAEGMLNLREPRLLVFETFIARRWVKGSKVLDPKNVSEQWALWCDMDTEFDLLTFLENPEQDEPEEQPEVWDSFASFLRFLLHKRNRNKQVIKADELYEALAYYTAKPCETSEDDTPEVIEVFERLIKDRGNISGMEELLAIARKI